MERDRPGRLPYRGRRYFGRQERADELRADPGVYTNLPGTATECTWTNSGPPSNDAALLFRVTDFQGDTTNSVLRFQIVEGAVGPLPTGWANGDVGAVAAAGSAGFDGNTFTIRGSGADIWGTADEFHWAFRQLSGDFEVTSRVVTVQNVNSWTKAGLMIRESNQPGSRHASIFATPGTEKPVAFQRRSTPNGASLHTAGPVHAPPVWLKLARAGDSVSAYYRTTAPGIGSSSTLRRLRGSRRPSRWAWPSRATLTARWPPPRSTTSRLRRARCQRWRCCDRGTTSRSRPTRRPPSGGCQPIRPASRGSTCSSRRTRVGPGLPSRSAPTWHPSAGRAYGIGRARSDRGSSKLSPRLDRGLQGEARSDPFRIVVNAKRARRHAARMDVRRRRQRGGQRALQVRGGRRARA